MQTMFKEPNQSAQLQKALQVYFLFCISLINFHKQPFLVLLLRPQSKTSLCSFFVKKLTTLCKKVGL